MTIYLIYCEDCSKFGGDYRKLREIISCWFQLAFFVFFSRNILQKPQTSSKHIDNKLFTTFMKETCRVLSHHIICIVFRSPLVALFAELLIDAIGRF
jgi:hypothetical protein